MQTIVSCMSVTISLYSCQPYFIQDLRDRAVDPIIRLTYPAVKIVNVEKQISEQQQLYSAFFSLRFALPVASGEKWAK